MAIEKVVVKYEADIKKLKSELKEARGSTQKLNTATKNTTKSVNGLNAGLKQVGSAIGVAFATERLIAFGKESVRLFEIQQKAESKVKQAIISTNNAAGLSFQRLANEASKLQKSTIFGDEQILNDATAQLLTFTNIAGDNFIRTQKVALDLATVLDGDLKSASIQLGKALNDPVANLSALSRSGIQFSKEQKATIKSLVETNKLAEAQGVILEELERQYGGQAEAAALVEGSMGQLNKSFGDLQETIGGLIKNGFEPLNKILNSTVIASDEQLKVQSSEITLLDKLKSLLGTVTDRKIALLKLAAQEEKARKQQELDQRILDTAFGKEEAFFTKKEVAQQKEIRNVFLLNQLIKEQQTIIKDRNTELEDIQPALQRLKELQEELKKLTTLREEDEREQRDSSLKMLDFSKENAKRDKEIKENFDNTLTETLEENSKRRLRISAESLQQELDQAEENAKKRMELEKRVQEEFISLAGSTKDTLFEFSRIESENELSLLNEQLKNKQISQEQFNQRSAQVKRNQAKADKDAALFDVFLSASTAIVKAIAESPGTFGLPFSAFATAQGALQIAAINARPLPKFAKGKVDIAGEGTTTSDSILAMISKGESVINANETAKWKNHLVAMNSGHYDKFLNKHYIPKTRQAKKEAGMSGFDDGRMLKAIKRNKTVYVENIGEIAGMFQKANKRGW